MLESRSKAQKTRTWA